MAKHSNPARHERCGTRKRTSWQGRGEPASLWDLIENDRKHDRPVPRVSAAPGARPARSERAARGLRIESDARPMSVRYEDLTREMLARYGVRVRKWRTSMSGVAWQITYHDGSVSRLIESPRPRGPMSCAIFLHEIGHHAIGFHRYRLRCVEEYHAWRFAIDRMERLGFNVTDRVRQRMCDSLRYAVEKAVRRGMREIPEELRPFVRGRRAG